MNKEKTHPHFEYMSWRSHTKSFVIGCVFFGIDKGNGFLVK